MTTGDNGHFFLRCCAKKQALTWRGKAGRTLKSAAKIVGTFAKDGFRMRTTARVRKTFQNPQKVDKVSLEGVHGWIEQDIGNFPPGKIITALDAV